MSDEPKSAAPLRVLFVEDDAVDRMAFDRFVRRQDLPWSCATAATLAEATALLEARPFDVVLTDYHLGDGDALELLELDLGVPVIMITGAGDEEIAVQAMRAGAFDYLVKDSERRYLKVVPVTVDNAHRHRQARIAQQRSQRELRESQERFALAAAGANDGLWDWDLRRQRIFFSPRWKLALGYREGEVADSPESWFDLVHPEDVELLRAQIDAHLSGSTPHFENEHRMRTREGSYRWVQTRGLAVRDDDGVAYRIAGSQRDITDRKRVEEQLTHEALHDSLTGLPNRALFMDRLDNAVKRRRRHPESFFAVIFLDLDRFKVINDSLGHQAGDLMLRGIARRLESCLRLGDTVARLGGDEFGILLEDLQDSALVDSVAERVHAELEAPFRIGGREVFTGASLGIALSTTGYENPEDILRDADTAMYRAKSLGRTRRVVFNPDMHARAVALLHLETDLRRAVERAEFIVHYQPFVALSDGQLRGFEALVRWRHPERGLLEPSEFLQAAHDTGLSVALGWWVLKEACRQLAAWRHELGRDAVDGLAVSVNLDARQLSSTELVERVSAALEDHGLAPRHLQLELTESTIIRNPEITHSILTRLSERGVRLHIDDFGTGYSSLSQLHRYPVDTLKIDRSFIGRMVSDVGELEIVRTIVSLAHNLKLEVMAEGVETNEQLSQLRELGCEFAQGFLFAPPLAAEKVLGLLRRGPSPWAGADAVLA